MMGRSRRAQSTSRMRYAPMFDPATASTDSRREYLRYLADVKAAAGGAELAAGTLLHHVALMKDSERESLQRTLAERLEALARLRNPI